MTKYTRLTLEEREKIHALVNQGKKDQEIATSLGRSKSTVLRELKRAPSRHEYSPSKAHTHAGGQAPLRGRKKLLEINPETWFEAIKLLVGDLSPEQISKTFKAEQAHNPLRQISHETIYKYIYALPRGELRTIFTDRLRSKRRLRKDRSNVHARRGQIPDAVPISERPAEVNDRAVPGHWEGDLIIGKNHKSALGTLVERTTRFLILVPIKGKDAKSVRESFSEVFNELEPDLRLSMTYDRGLEMAEHKTLTEETGVKVYFCDPHSPWQRGTNENTNGLIRQYFPKKTDFTKVPLDRIKWVQERLNTRPRKVLNFSTPLKEFTKLIGALET